MLFSTFLIAGMVIDEATEKYGRFYRIDQENMDTFERCCEAFDFLIDAAGDQECDLEISVDEDDMTVCVELTLPTMLVATEYTPKFRWVTDWALSMENTNTEDGRVRVRFVFPSLWVVC